MSSDRKNATPAQVFGFLFSHWGRQRAVAGFIAALLAAATVADVLTPLFAGNLVDAVTHGSGPGARALAFRALMWLTLLGLGAVLARQAAFWAIVRFTLRMMTDIKAEAFAHVQTFSTQWHGDAFSGAIVRQILRGAGAVDMLNDVLFFGLLPTSVMLVGATIVLGWHWKMLGLAIAVGNAVYVGVTVALALYWIEPAAELSNAWDTRVSAGLADAITSNAAVRAFGAEQREERRLGQLLGKWGSRTKRTWMRGVTTYSVQSFMLVGLQLLIAGFATLLWQQGRAGAGDVATVLSLYFVLLGYLRNVGQNVRETQRAVADMHELVGLSATDAALEDKAGAPALVVADGRIDVRAIGFRYHAGATRLFDDLSLSIAGGERVGLVGPSGSGKSTFVRLIQRLHDVEAGAILIDGQDIARVTQHSLRSQIAIVPQDPALFHRTLAENIAYGRPHATAEEIEHAARMAHAHEFIVRQPRGYATLVGERGIKLSGGERQRVAIARAFLADRPILVLDEATSSLDSESEAAIAEAAARLMQGRTCIVIAHRLSTVRAMDRIVVFRHGEIVEQGPHGALVARPGGLYRELFERQALGLVQAE